MGRHRTRDELSKDRLFRDGFIRNITLHAVAPRSLHKLHVTSAVLQYILMSVRNKMLCLVRRAFLKRRPHRNKPVQPRGSFYGNITLTEGSAPDTLKVHTCQVWPEFALTHDCFT